MLHLFIFHLQNDPQEGAKHGGTAGFLKGLGSGLVEAVQRPAEGISILTHQLGTGLKKTPDAIFGEENRGYGPPLVGDFTPLCLIAEQLECTSFMTQFPSSCQKGASFCTTVMPAAVFMRLCKHIRDDPC